MTEDIFQETFMKAIITIRQGRYNENGKFSAWLRRIAHNLIIDSFRQEKSENLVSCDEPEIDPLFKRLNDRKDPAHLQKSDYEQLCSIAKNMRSIKSFLFDRRNQLNRQTAVIRHKIGTDCGRGGQAWEASILASKGAR